MKQLCYILVLCSFLLLSFSGVIRLVSFTIFQPYISAKRCVNLDKPQVKCEGKCFLKKLMKEEAQQKKDMPDFHKLDLFFESASFVVPTSSAFSIRTTFTRHLLPRGISSPECHSPPPQAV